MHLSRCLADDYGRIAHITLERLVSKTKRPFVAGVRVLGFVGCAQDVSYLFVPHHVKFQTGFPMPVSLSMGEWSVNSVVD